MVKRQNISWRPSGAGKRLFGAFAGYTEDGKVRVSRGAATHILLPSEVTWEMQ